MDFGLDPYMQFWFSTSKATIEATQHHTEGNVSSMDDYVKLRPHLFPSHSEAIESMGPWAEKQKEGRVVVWATLEGFFWFPRTCNPISDEQMQAINYGPGSTAPYAVKKARYFRVDNLRSGSVKTKNGWNVQDFAHSMFNPNSEEITVNLKMVSDNTDQKVTYTIKHVPFYGGQYNPKNGWITHFREQVVDVPLQKHETKRLTLMELYGWPTNQPDGFYGRLFAYYSRPCRCY